ncbi:MAG: hypothetical protein E7017_00820 [Alphaproteobacteria bacterium]|nr:hypothetical protein [Alphaproteobacteria bacterium]
MVNNTMFVCFCKDFRFFFQTKMIYLLLFIYTSLVFAITFYTTDIFTNPTINMYQFFKFQPGVMAMIIPALTMRLWADEVKHNTLEVLLSQPIWYQDVVIGKFLATWSVVGIMLLLSTPFWFVTEYFSSTDILWVLINYFVVFLMSGVLCAISLLGATIFYNVIGAFFAGLIACVIMVSVPLGQLVFKFLPSEVFLYRIAEAFDFGKQYNDMIMGQVGLIPLIYFCLLIIASLWITVIVVEYKRS